MGATGVRRGGGRSRGDGMIGVIGDEKEEEKGEEEGGRGGGRRGRERGQEEEGICGGGGRLQIRMRDEEICLRPSLRVVGNPPCLAPDTAPGDGENDGVVERSQLQRSGVEWSG